MSEAKQPPKDAAQRKALKDVLTERMRISIQQQGAYGVRQTALWEKAYCRAQLICKREYPMQRTIKKAISNLDAAHAWKVEPGSST